MPKGHVRKIVCPRCGYPYCKILVESRRRWEVSKGKKLKLVEEERENLIVHCPHCGFDQEIAIPEVEWNSKDELVEFVKEVTDLEVYDRGDRVILALPPSLSAKVRKLQRQDPGLLAVAITAGLKEIEKENGPGGT